jgi:hypothetical protein
MASRSLKHWSHGAIWPLGLGLALLSGCAGVHLHSEANYEVATKAQTAFDDAKLASSVADERTRLTQILQRELTAVRRQTLATRDAHLLAILVGGDFDTSWGQFDRAATGRLDQLLGKNRSVVLTLGDALNRLKSAQERLRDKEFAYRRLRPGPDDPVLKCPIPAAPAPPPQRLALREAYTGYVEDCQTVTEHKRIIESSGASGSQWQQLVLELAEADTQQRKTAEFVEQLKKDYARAKTAHEAALKGANASVIQTTAAALQTGLADFDVLGAAGQIAALQEQLDALNAILEALTKGVDSSKPATDPSQQTVLRIASFLPALEKRIGTAYRYPGVAPLLLAAEHLRLQLAAAQQTLGTQRSRLNLLRKKLDAMATEMTLLNTASRWMTGVDTLLDQKSKNPCKRTAAFVVDYSGWSPNCREQVVAGLLLYADSWTVGRLPQHEIDHLLIGLRHAASVDASENALLQWQNLIGVPLAQLVAFHKGGITSEDLANLINAIGLGGIAVGVNRR